MLSLILINSRNPPILIIKIRQIRYKTGLIKQTPWKIWLPLIFLNILIRGLWLNEKMPTF